METILVCRRVVWGKSGSEQQMPYGLQIGKDDVKTATEKVGEKVVVEEFDGNRSGYVNFYFHLTVFLTNCTSDGEDSAKDSRTLLF